MFRLTDLMAEEIRSNLKGCHFASCVVLGQYSPKSGVDLTGQDGFGPELCRKLGMLPRDFTKHEDHRVGPPFWAANLDEVQFVRDYLRFDCN
jgi:hypothetical protein